MTQSSCLGLEEFVLVLYSGVPVLATRACLKMCPPWSKDCANSNLEVRSGEYWKDEMCHWNCEFLYQKPCLKSLASQGRQTDPMLFMAE